jgi:3-keto-L-gulonate-6-phosphate decarboxylase
METRKSESILQLALDYPSLDRAATLVSSLLPALERIEIGTPLVLAAGFAAMERVRSLSSAPLTLVADVKICDAGERIARSAFSAGADVITAVAAAIDHQTWRGIITAAADRSDQTNTAAPVLLDTIGWRTDLTLLREFAVIAADAGVPVALCIHRPKELPGTFAELIAPFTTQDAPRLHSYVVAGKLAPTDVVAALEAGFETLIVGGAISDAPDPSEAWSQFRAQVSSVTASGTAGH